jgi:hypothetical protein
VSRGRHNVVVRSAAPVLAGAAAFVLAGVLAGSLWLWTGYGATVFFETIRVGYTACFG